MTFRLLLYSYCIETTKSRRIWFEFVGTSFILWLTLYIFNVPGPKIVYQRKFILQIINYHLVGWNKLQLFTYMTVQYKHLNLRFIIWWRSAWTHVWTVFAYKSGFCSLDTFFDGFHWYLPTNLKWNVSKSSRSGSSRLVSGFRTFSCRNFVRFKMHGPSSGIYLCLFGTSTFW